MDLGKVPLQTSASSILTGKVKDLSTCRDIWKYGLQIAVYTDPKGASSEGKAAAGRDAVRVRTEAPVAKCKEALNYACSSYACSWKLARVSN